MTKKFLQRYELFKGEKLQRLTLLKNQGYCNVNYLLETSKKRYLIRLFKMQGLDRNSEFEVATKASKLGLCAKPLLLDKENSLMIAGFTEGSHKENLKLQEIKRVAKTIRKLHGIKWYKKPFNLKREYQSYPKKPLKKRLSRTNALFCELDSFQKEYVLCHHDLNPKNILFHGKDIKIIDWEYAGVSDRYFDLASVVVEFKLNKKETKVFLQSYFDSKERIDLKKLEVYKKVYRLLCHLWFYART